MTRNMESLENSGRIQGEFSQNSRRIHIESINRVEFNPFFAMDQLFGFSEQFATNWGQISEANYGEFAIIEVFDSLKKTKPDSLTYKLRVLYEI